MDSKYRYLQCRLCLCKNNGLCDIFEDNGKQGFTAADIITDLLLFQVSRSDGYPQFVCLKCNDRLTEFKNFKEDCQKSKLKFESEHPSNTAGFSIRPFAKTNAEATAVVVVKTPRFGSSNSEEDNKNLDTPKEIDIYTVDKNARKFHNIVLKKHVEECDLKKKSTLEKGKTMEANSIPPAAQEIEEEIVENNSIPENSSVTPEVISSIPFRINTWERRKKVLECIECERRFWDMKKFNVHMKGHRGLSCRYNFQKEQTQDEEDMIKESETHTSGPQRNKEVIESESAAKNSPFPLKQTPLITSPLTSGEWKWKKKYECIECFGQFSDMENFNEHMRVTCELDSKKKQAKEKEKKLEQGKIIPFVAQRKEIPVKSHSTRENSANLKNNLPNPFSVNAVECTKKILECQREIFDITDFNLQEPGEVRSLVHEFNTQKETNKENEKKLEVQTMPCFVQKREEKVIASKSSIENFLVIAKKNSGQTVPYVIQKREEKVIASKSAMENSLVIPKKNLGQTMPCVIRRREDKIFISNTNVQNSSALSKQIPSIPFALNEADCRKKVFECTVCRKRFLDLKNCGMHMKTHKGMKSLLHNFHPWTEPTKENENIQKGLINPLNLEKEEQKEIPKQISSFPFTPNAGDCKNNVPECIKCRMKFLDVKDFDVHMNRHKEEESLSHALGSQNEPAEENQMTQESQIDICVDQFYQEEVVIDDLDDENSPGITTQDPSIPFGVTARESKENEVFQCSQCPEKFTQKRKFNEHMKIHREEKSYQCEFCGMRFKWNFMLKDHQKIHSGEKPFKCQFCCKCFTQRSSLEKHISKVHLEARFSCDWCTRKFSTMENLKNHLKLHRQFRPFGCDQCERRFLTAEAAEKHKLFHSGETPFVCDICSRTFEQKVRLARHVRRSHGGERPYACNLCDRRFFQRYELKLHMTLHTGERAFTCEECGKTFRSKANLTVHSRVHTGVKPYLCNLCDKRFSQRGSLHSHMKSHYNPPRKRNVKEKKTHLTRVFDMEGEFFAYI